MSKTSKNPDRALRRAKPLAERMERAVRPRVITDAKPTEVAKAYASKPAQAPRATTVAAHAIVTSVQTVTPELAAKWLESYNSANRPLRESRVNRYARDMIRGDWIPNAETVKFSTNGVLLDGQHRLWAVVMANVTVPMLIARNVPEEAMATIDTGAPRNFSDVLRIRGHARYVTQIPAVLRLLTWYERTKGSSDMFIPMTHAEMDDAFAAHPDVEEACRAVMCTGRLKRMVAPSLTAFVYYHAAKDDPAKAGAWLQLLDSGAGMSNDNPVYLLREILLAERSGRDRMTQRDLLALMVRSWWHFRRGSRLKLLRRLSAGDAFPEF